MNRYETLEINIELNFKLKRKFKSDKKYHLEAILSAKLKNLPDGVERSGVRPCAQQINILNLYRQARIIRFGPTSNP